MSGGTLALTGGSTIGQTGAIHAAALSATTTNGPITLTNSGNSFATATLATGGADNATLYDASALTIAGANVGGTFALTGGGAIGQSGAIHAAALNATTTSGAITLTNSGNAFGPVTLQTSGSDDASLYDAPALVIASANVGGTLTLTSGSTIGQTGAIHAANLNAATTNGAITLTNSGNAFNTATLATGKFGQRHALRCHGADRRERQCERHPDVDGGGSTIGQSGAIHATALNVTTTNGAITLTNTGNSFAAATLATSGSDNASLYDAANLVIASANIGGDLTLSGGGTIGQTGAIHAHTLNVTTTGGAITLTNSGNAFDFANVSTAGSDNASLTDSSALTVASAGVGGTLTLTGASTIGQTGAIHAHALNASTTNGTITLTNAGNAIDIATLTTTGLRWRPRSPMRPILSSLRPPSAATSPCRAAAASASRARSMPRP